MKTEMRIEMETKMFGCTIEEMKADIVDALGGTAMMAMSILSDSQEQIERGYSEDARQSINRAKYILSKIHSEQRRTEREN